MISCHLPSGYHSSHCQCSGWNFAVLCVSTSQSRTQHCGKFFPMEKDGMAVYWKGWHMVNFRQEIAFDLEWCPLMLGEQSIYCQIKSIHLEIPNCSCSCHYQEHHNRDDTCHGHCCRGWKDKKLVLRILMNTKEFQ